MPKWECCPEDCPRAVIAWSTVIQQSYLQVDKSHRDSDASAEPNAEGWHTIMASVQAIGMVAKARMATAAGPMSHKTSADSTAC